MWTFVSGFFHVTCFLGSSMLLHVLEVHSFLLLSSMSLYKGIRVLFISYLMDKIHQFGDDWVVSSLGLLWITLLWTFVYKSLFSFLSYRHLRVEYLSHMVSVCLTFQKLSNSFSKWLCHVIFQSAVWEGSSISTSSPTLGIVSLFNHCHSCGMYWFSTMFLICTFLITSYSLICHVFNDVLIQIVCPFLWWGCCLSYFHF